MMLDPKKILFFVALGGAATAQVDVGRISGVVSDSSGAVIPGVQVVITRTDTNFQMHLVTNSAGVYSAPALWPGTYRLTASSSGFRTETRTGIELRVQEHLEINFRLDLSATVEEITVSAEAPLLESTTSSLGQVVGERTVADLPLNGRNFIALATLGAGTLPGSARTNERNNFVANGARPIQNSYLLDGVENKNRIFGFDGSSAQAIHPVIDAIQEFKVQTSNFSAEFGQAAGGVVNVTLKSGTNRFHGSLFEYFRNSQLDARPYFQPPGGGKPLLIQNQFGGTVGGPIRRDQTFFFASWQRSRERSSAPQIATVPTLAAREGIGPRPLFDPSTTQANPAGSGFLRRPFAGNRVPASAWDPVATRLAALYPAPNLPGAAANHFFNPKEKLDNDQYNIRIDHKVSDRDTIFGRLSVSSSANALPGPLPDPANEDIIAEPTSQSAVFNHTRLFSSSVLNEFRFGFMRTRLQEQTLGPRRFEEFGIRGTLNEPSIRGLPNFAISGLSRLGPTLGTLPIPATGSTNVPIDKWGRVFQFIDNLSWVWNRHSVKVGVEVQHVTAFAHVTSFARPILNFNGVFTQNPQARGGTGDGYADFLLGLVTSASIATQRH